MRPPTSRSISKAFDARPPDARVWRVAHLSDVHVVGERYGFRIESGRGGPRGNGRLERALARLAALHAARPLDLVLITGDMTDAGTSAEWAEFLDMVAAHPELAERMLILPGNHDVNIVDRANPARLDLPFSPVKALRKMRALSAMDAVQGERVLTGDGETLAEALETRRREIEEFAEEGGFRRSAELARLWQGLFPLILPPDRRGRPRGGDPQFQRGYEFLLHQRARPHGGRGGAAADRGVRRYPKARWIVALHHHLIEYPMPVAAFSERVGTALINGSWFLRVLKPYASRARRHARPSPQGLDRRLRVDEDRLGPLAGDGAGRQATHLYIHTLAAGPDGSIRLLEPERVELAAEVAA